MTLKKSLTKAPRLRRVLASVAAVSAAALVLAGCSTSGSGSSSGSSSTKKLTLWLSSSAAQQAGYNKLVAEYKKATGVTVKIVNIPYSGYTTKLHEAAQANALPDIASVPSLDPIWTNKLIDLSSIVNTSADKINKNFIAKTSKGQVLAIPSDVTASGLFINKSLFQKAGVSFPTSPSSTWTWTQLMSKLDQVRKATGAKYDMTFDPSPSRLRAMVYEMGGKYVHADSSGTFSVDAATKKAVNTFVGWNNDTIIPKSVWTSGADPSALFQSGQVVAYWSGVWQVAAFASSITNFDWASVPTPAQPVQASDVNSGGLVVGFNNSSSESTAAKNFLTWMYAPKQYKTLTEVNGYLPVESGLNPTYPFSSQAAQDAFKLYNEELPLYAPVSGYFNQAQTQWVLAGKSLTTDPSVTEIGKAINGQETSDQALANVVAAYNQQVGGVK
ncbi:extracellular solute-binding protein [Curtobacterium ammoniigenes]|uniref:extracellular solute-binding protein n=1 Tax=Curtobacterium ammoniigenes TaxID=395387 RepID=UPI0008335C89|nr:extracellular solute-binding protein [Curtobacterium ammoniigenes]